MRQSVIQGQLEEISNANDLDESLRNVLIQLNKAGYSTIGSCSGYRWEHCGEGTCCCRFKPFVSIMVYKWEVKDMLLKFKQDLSGTYWNVECKIQPTYLIENNRKKILGYSRNLYWDEKYDLLFASIFLSYKKDLLDEQIKRGWDILLSRLVGD